MAKKIIWTFRAINDRKQIFSYWDKRNKSDRYSIKLDYLFNTALKIVAIHPAIGRQTSKENIRVKIVRDYFLIYEVNNDLIILLSIWDTRRNPKDMDL